MRLRCLKVGDTVAYAHAYLKTKGRGAIKAYGPNRAIITDIVDGAATVVWAKGQGPEIVPIETLALVWRPEFTRKKAGA
jgi:hypothetical protein